MAAPLSIPPGNLDWKRDLLFPGHPYSQRFAIASLKEIRSALLGLITHGRLIFPADLKQCGIDVPLHSVAEEMSQQKQTLFRSDRVVNIDFRSVQVASQWIRNISGHDVDPVKAL